MFTAKWEEDLHEFVSEWTRKCNNLTSVVDMTEESRRAVFVMLEMFLFLKWSRASRWVLSRLFLAKTVARHMRRPYQLFVMHYSITKEESKSAGLPTHHIYPDLSTFDARWSVALSETEDFITFGGTVGGVVQRASRQWNALKSGALIERNTPTWLVQSQTGAALPGSTVGVGVGVGVGFINVGQDETDFLFLDKLVPGALMYTRSLFDDLYQQLLVCWTTRHRRVLIEGNAGTGKSWFQLFAIRKLMLDYGYGTGHDFLFMIRPAGSEYHLIDLATGDARHLELKSAGDTSVLNSMNLARFGGIVRHVLAEGTADFWNEQPHRIASADPNVLRARGVHIDDKSTGGNVSGFLLRFCNIPLLEGPNRFKYSELDVTSKYVEQAIRTKLADYSLQDHVDIVLDHIDGKQVDRSGLHLQESVGMILSKGNQLVWKMAMVGHVAPVNAAALRWSTFRTQKRDVVKLYTVVEQMPSF
eukprot:scaffold28590_cov57-Attheya_sp.AAC.1